jgi:hypothetical protein
MTEVEVLGSTETERAINECEGTPVPAIASTGEVVWYSKLTSPPLEQYKVARLARSLHR